MSIPSRIYRISKAYLNQVRQRIDDELAERELDAGLAGSGDPVASAGSGVLDDDPAVSAAEQMMRRAEERIAAARREMQGGRELGAAPSDSVSGSGSTAAAAAQTTVSPGAAPSTRSPMATPPLADADPNASDFRVLNVPPGSDLATVQSAYEKLLRRLDPNRFTEDPASQKEAERILERVNAAYEALRNRLDPTQNRFGKLELE